MKLFSGPLSLYSRKVEIALREKGLSFEREVVAFSQTDGYKPKHPNVLAANPKGQVPVFVDNGLTLYDSTVILEYLEDAYPSPALFPHMPDERARCRLLDVFADEIMIVPLRALMHRTEPRSRETEAWVAAEAKARQAEAVIETQFQDLDRRLGDKTYFCGSLTVADISVFMAVFYSQRLGGPGLVGQPALQRWFSGLIGRPSFSKAVAEIIAADRELSASVGNAYRGLSPSTLPSGH
jgi:glutathione S-transferase